MATGLKDPKLLYAIDGVKAYHIANGMEELLTPNGTETLSLLMVPTSSAFAHASQADRESENAEEDFYLHLHLPPELDLPLPATAQIYHQPPTSYLIPRWDLGHDSGAFTRIEFPSTNGRKGVQEDVDTFETILAQCTAFLERTPPPRTGTATGPSGSRARKGEELPPYNPGNYKPGEAYVQGSKSHQPGGQIVLVDEEDGSVIGELAEGYQVVEDSTLKPGSKEPVEITLPAQEGQKVSVAPATPEYLEMALHPAYKNSSLVANAAAASRLIVMGGDLVGKALQGGASTFTQKTQPAPKPLTFKPTTKEHIRRINAFTGSAAGLSAKTIGQVSHFAQNIGASLASKKKYDLGQKGMRPGGKPVEQFRPGLLNKSLMAFTTVIGGVEHAGKSLLTTTTDAAGTVVGHRWGAEAGDVTRSLGAGVKNVGLVYIDVTGVSRRAILKSVAKGMVVGRTSDGSQVVVGGEDGTVGISAHSGPCTQLPKQGQVSASERPGTKH